MNDKDNGLSKPCSCDAGRGIILIIQFGSNYQAPVQVHSNSFLFLYLYIYISNRISLGKYDDRTRLESTGTSPGIWNLDCNLWTLDFFYELRMTQPGLPTHSLSQRLLKHFFDNVLLEHVGLIRLLPLAVQLFFFCSEQVEGVILSNFYSLGFILKS